MQIVLKCTIRECKRFFSFDVTEEKIKSKNRKRELVFCRRVVIKICTDNCRGLSQGEIGFFLGGRDHSTVIHNIKEHVDLIDTNDTLYVDFFNSVDKRINEIIKKLTFKIMQRKAA